LDTRLRVGYSEKSIVGKDGIGMNRQFEFKKATREGVKALIGFYGRSGGGKTLSALLVARGLVGPQGRIALVDSENGRGSLFADVVPGGYNIVDIDAPFSPDAYAGAIEVAEKHADIVVVDSMSHEWSGEGGVLDMQEAELERMAGDNFTKREQCKMAAWIKPKKEHKSFTMRLLRLRCPLICCLRGEEKTHMVKGSNGEKAKVITDEFSTPLFDPRFIFEMLINFEVVARRNSQTGLMEGGFAIPMKITHPSVASFLPRENEQIGVKFGEALAAWCRNAGGPSIESLKKELWSLSKAPKGDMATFEKFCWSLGLEPSKNIKELTIPEIETLIVKAREKSTTLL
jgi:hypothetical protein